jgi:hypothetical protein
MLVVELAVRAVPDLPQTALEMYYGEVAMAPLVFLIVTQVVAVQPEELRRMEVMHQRDLVELIPILLQVMVAVALLLVSVTVVLFMVAVDPVLGLQTTRQGQVALERKVMYWLAGQIQMMVDG